MASHELITLDRMREIRNSLCELTRSRPQFFSCSADSLDCAGCRYIRTIVDLEVQLDLLMREDRFNYQQKT